MNFPLSVSPRKEMENRTRPKKITDLGGNRDESKSWVIMAVTAGTNECCADSTRRDKNDGSIIRDLSSRHNIHT